MKINNYFFLIIIALTAFNLNAKAQCTQPLDDCSLGVTIPPLAQCPGSTYLFNPILEPGFSFTGEVWTPGSGPSWITGWSPASLVIPPGTAPGVYSYSLNVTGLGPEQVIDGDFSSTVTPCGYTTDYTYSTGAGTISEPYIDPYGGYYSITDNITSVTTPGAPFALLGEPHMLAINGFATGPSNVWAEKLTVCPGATYQFSFDYAAWTTGGGLAQPNIQVNIGSSYFTSYFVTSGTWTTQTYTWTAPAAPGPYTIQITDLTGALPYNDLTITNISFRRIINGSIPFTVTVNPVPAFTPIVSPTPICSGIDYILDATLGSGCTMPCTYLWSGPFLPTPPTTIPSTVIGGSPSGIYTEMLTVTNSFGCSTTNSVIVDVMAQPNGGNITGPKQVCSGQTYTYFDVGGDPYGTWVCTYPGAIIVPSPPLDFSADIIFPIVSVPTPAFITYTVINSCGTSVASYPIIIQPIPVVSPISGPTTICAGQTITLSDATPGGTWGFDLGSLPALIDPTGDLTALAGTPGGLILVTYTVTLGSCSTSQYYDVNAIPEPNVCVTEEFIDEDYYYNFSTSFGSGVTADYIGFDPFPTFTILGCTMSTAVPAIPVLNWYTDVYALCPGAFGVCIKTVHYEGCSWSIPHSESCCAEMRHGSFVGYRHIDTSGSVIAQHPEQYLNITPNPNRGTFTIQGTIADVAPTAEVNFEVLDILGKTIITDVATIENGSINKTITLADNIANGMYMLRIKADGTNKVIKFTLDR